METNGSIFGSSKQQHTGINHMANIGLSTTGSTELNNLIFPRNMNVTIARILIKSAKDRYMVIYNPEVKEGRRFTFMPLTKVQCIKLIEGGIMPTYDDEFKSLSFRTGDYSY